MCYSNDDSRYKSPNYQHYYSLLHKSNSKKSDSTIHFETRIRFRELPSKSNLYPEIELSYRHNPILLMQPNSIKFIGTDWYTTRTTQRKLRKFSPFVNSYFGLATQDSTYKSLHKHYYFLDLRGTINIPILDYSLDPSFNHSNFFSISSIVPLYEGLTLLKQTHNNQSKLVIPQYESLTQNFKSLTSNSLIQQLSSIYLSSLSQRRNLLLVINSHRHCYSNERIFIIDTDTYRLQSKLTSQFLPFFDNFMTSHNLLTEYPHFLYYRFTSKSSSISTLQLLQDIDERQFSSS